MRTSLLIILFSFPFICLGQQNAITEDGKEILIYPDNTWKFNGSASGLVAFISKVDCESLMLDSMKSVAGPLVEELLQKAEQMEKLLLQNKTSYEKYLEAKNEVEKLKYYAKRYLNEIEQLSFQVNELTRELESLKNEPVSPNGN